MANKMIEIREEVYFHCPKCLCRSRVNYVWLLSKDEIKRNQGNDITIGNAFEPCPVCGDKHYFWREEESEVS